jgi:hypothetical protein
MVNYPGTDSRGVAIDPSARVACEHALSPQDPRIEQCAPLYPAALYIGSRTPPSLIIGRVGVQPSFPDSSYDPDSLAFSENVPLLAGVSRVYMAPIVNAAGNYEMRVFVVAFDSNTVFVYNPNTGEVDRIPVGNGPFALAFDPFSLEDVALGRPVLGDPRHPDSPEATTPLGLKTYRFAYVASFTNSYVQVIDLDDSRVNKTTFETVVYTVGNPTIPKGTQQND